MSEQSAFDAIDIHHLARLARLSLNEAETADARQDLVNIIAMIDEMQTVDTEGIAPMAHPLDATQRLREDRVSEEVDVATFQQNAPAAEDGYYLVPRVVE